MKTPGPAGGVLTSLRCGLAGMLMALVSLTVSAHEIGVAARVNGAEISIFRLERYFEDYLREQGRNLGAIRNPTAYKRLKREALDRLIERELLSQEAVRRGLSVSPEALAAARTRLEAAYKTPEAFQRRLREAGFSEPDFTDYVRRDLLARQALAELTTSTEPAADEVQRAYRENRERFVLPERVRARHILLRFAAGTTAQEKEEAREAARRRLLGLAGQLRQGANFAQLAERHSEDVTRKTGGDLGIFPRGKMVPAFERIAFSLSPGEVSEPVETEYGWHLIWVDERFPAEKMPEEQALAMVRQRLASERQAAAVGQVLQKLRQAARVEVLLAL